MSQETDSNAFLAGGTPNAMASFNRLLAPSISSQPSPPEPRTGPSLVPLEYVTLQEVIDRWVEKASSREPESQTAGGQRRSIERAAMGSLVYTLYQGLLECVVRVGAIPEMYRVPPHLWTSAWLDLPMSDEPDRFGTFETILTRERISGPAFGDYIGKTPLLKQTDVAKWLESEPSGLGQASANDDQRRELERVKLKMEKFTTENWERALDKLDLDPANRSKKTGKVTDETLAEALIQEYLNLGGYPATVRSVARYLRTARKAAKGG